MRELLFIDGSNMDALPQQIGAEVCTRHRPELWARGWWQVSFDGDVAVMRRDYPDAFLVPPRAAR